MLRPLHHAHITKNRRPTLHYNFDQHFDRSNTSSTKWEKFAATDALPFWVADMDFAAPDFILQALRDRLEHPILGYTNRPPSLNEAFQKWLEHHFGWRIPEQWIVWLPGVVPGLNLAAQTQEPGTSLLIPTPVYYPFFDLARNAGLQELRVAMSVTDGHWQMDWQAMADALLPSTRMIVICNPQNPTGRCFSDTELAELADFVERHDLILVSDEIHCSLILDPACHHSPIAGSCPEIAPRTITLFAATKSYNIPGVGCAAAVIPDAKLRARFRNARAGLMPSIGPLGFIASEVAFSDRSDWLPQLLEYLRSNLEMVQAAVGDRLAPVQATYLAWIDVENLEIEDTEAYFVQHGLGLSPGAQFGAPGHVRFNFGCPKATLQIGLERLRKAIAAR